MSNVNNLTSKIIGDATIKCDEIIGSARAEEAKIMENKISEAKVLEADILTKANREAFTRKERIISNAQLTVRDNKLAAKQVVIDKVFSQALEKLNDLSEGEQLAFIKGKIEALGLKGDYTLQVNEKISQASILKLVDELNNKFSSAGKVVRISLSSNPGAFQGGFILEKGGIEINNTFESLVSSMRDDLEYEVTKALFS